MYVNDLFTVKYLKLKNNKTLLLPMEMVQLDLSVKLCRYYCE